MKKYQWIADYCLDKSGVKHEFKTEWGVDLFKIGDKFFVMLGGDKTGQPIVSVKCEPHLAEELRQDYEGKIVPGYYLNKSHWNSIYLESDVPVKLIKEQIDQSYELIKKGLPKKMQLSLDTTC